jgi:DNA (cytosine-5)-methyltransferase 1
MNATLFGRVRGPIVVDLFAGGGGASAGIVAATGHSPVVAVNHCEHAIRLHTLNHPETHHFQQDVFQVNPRIAARGRRVDALWASPDCRHFSRAKGGVPLKKEIRSLAWAVRDWARELRPRLVLMENVEEFQAWGPLGDDNRPIKARAGETFAEFIAALEDLGYDVEWRTLVAADYGSPTSRKRLFLVARNDGRRIVWPAPTHGPGRAQPWRTAAECIDWSIPMLSIFATPAEARAWAKATGADGVPKRPLAPATLRRIAAGIDRFVLRAARPFIVGIDNRSSTSATWSADAPLTTVVQENRHAVVAPVIVKARSHGSDTPRSGQHAGDAPFPTQTATETFGLAAVHLIDTGNSEREGQAPRARGVDQPMRTATATGSQGAVVAAYLAQHNGGANGHQAIGRALDEPMQTIAGNVNKAPVAVWLEKLHGSARVGQSVDAPMPTVTSGGGRGGGHAALVAAFLCAYYGTEKDGQALDEPARTITAKARLGLVTVHLDGVEYAVVDIAMRMLQPRELARAQGFPDDYIISTGDDTKGDQVARIGNSVCPQVAEALVRANLVDADCDAAAAR